MPKKKRRRTISKKKLKEKRLAAYPQPIHPVGSLVQVNDDVMDANWDDLPLGGWVGEVTKIHREKDEPKYDVRWSSETLTKCHPIYKQLAELEDLRIDEYQKIDEKDLHAFTGGAVTLVDPVDVSQYTDRPLDPEDHIDRLRMIFGTKPLDWFPMLGDGDDEEEDLLLRRYYDYLSERLVVPFEATYVNRRGGRVFSRSTFTVEKLIDPDVVKTKNWDDSQRLYCSGPDPDGNLLEVPLQKVACDAAPQNQLLDDYRSWIGEVFFEWGFDDE
jgi:hypothetical protein